MYGLPSPKVMKELNDAENARIKNLGGALAFWCGTCGVAPGVPCNKRPNQGGPNHLTRVDKHIRTWRKTREDAPWLEQRVVGVSDFRTVYLGKVARMNAKKRPR